MMADPAGLLREFMPHGMCYVWQPDILWLNVASDATIALAYFSIPIALFHFLRNRIDVPFRGVVLMFSIFIFACGVSHLMGIWVVWNGHYGVQGMVKAFTAIVSIMTAIMLYPVVPRMLAMRSPLELEMANSALQQEIVERERSESRATAFVESAPDATVIANDDHAIEVVNAQAEMLFGYTRDELIGQPIEKLVPLLFHHHHPEYRVGYSISLRLPPAGIGQNLMGRRKDGSEFPVEISLSPVGSEDQPLVSAAIRDISDRLRKEAQNRELEQDLAHVGRLSTMGQMAAGLAHELNQPLTAISQNTDTALLTVKQSASNDPELCELLQDIEDDAQRAGEIIRALRQFVRKDHTSKVAIDLNTLIHQTIRLLAPDAHDNNVTITVAAGDIPEPVVDRVQIAQVLVNLVRNGIESIATTDGLRRDILVTTSLLDGEIGVSVADTGPGLDPQVEVFKSFETSKTDGMGMGLSISRAIVESHGGALCVDRTYADGARFVFTLPLGEK